MQTKEIQISKTLNGQTNVMAKISHEKNLNKKLWKIT